MGGVEGTTGGAGGRPKGSPPPYAPGGFAGEPAILGGLDGGRPPQPAQRSAVGGFVESHRWAVPAAAVAVALVLLAVLVSVVASAMRGPAPIVATPTPTPAVTPAPVVTPSGVQVTTMPSPAPVGPGTTLGPSPQYPGSTALVPGKFTVGEPSVVKNPDGTTAEGPVPIGPGRYSAAPADPKFAGSLAVTPVDAVNGFVVNEAVGGDAGVPTVVVVLARGDVVQVAGAPLVLTPVTTVLVTALTTGRWSVPGDIAPGSYTVAAATGRFGNLIVYSGGKMVSNKILGGDYGAASVDVTLAAGNEVVVTGMPSATFTMAGGTAAPTTAPPAPSTDAPSAAPETPPAGQPTTDVPAQPSQSTTATG